MSVPAGSSRSPEDALDRWEGTLADFQDVLSAPEIDRLRDDVATVRERLERLTSENERLNRYIDQYILDVERLTEERDEAPRSCDLAWEQLKLAQRGFRGRDAAEAEVTRLTAELQHTREGLRDKDGQPIRNAARALLRATDNAERNAALGDLYNLLAATPPSVARTEGDGDCEHDYVFESDDPVTYRCDKCGARSDDGVYPRVGSFHPHKPLSGGGAK